MYYFKISRFFLNYYPVTSLDTTLSFETNTNWDLVLKVKKITYSMDISKAFEATPVLTFQKLVYIYE